MKVNIPVEIYKRSGKSIENIESTLNWIIGYYSSKNKPYEMISILKPYSASNISIEIDDEIIAQIKIKFRNENYDNIISVILAFAYSIGGME